jgi:hypothetical protein
MTIVNEEVNIGGIADIFTRYPEYHQIKLVCSLEDIKPYKLKRTSQSEDFDNVSTFPGVFYEYEIVISGSTFNCFENCPLSIFLTFHHDKFAWEKCLKSLENSINTHRVVMINADVYNIQGGEFSLFNPIISPTNCRIKDMGFNF